MKIKDLQSCNLYEGARVTREVVIPLSLEQTLKVSPGDLLVFIPEIKMFLFMDAKDIEERFLIISED